MLNWIRDKLFRRPSILRTSTTAPEGSNTSCPDSKPLNSESNMHAENSSRMQSNDKITLNVIHEGEIWVISVDRHLMISDLINMAIGHFFDPKEHHQSNSKYKFVSVLQKRLLNSQCTVEEADLKVGDEILLITTVSSGGTVPLKLTLQDIKGPSKEEVMEATSHLTKQNSVKLVPSFDCQENFQSEIRKVLYTLVEASAKMLAQSPDAKIIFDGIAARINAKNKKEIDKNAVKYLKDLGFTEAQARYALRLKRNRQVEAMEWLLEHGDRVKEDIEESMDVASTSTTTDDSPLPDDPLLTINKLLKDIKDFHLHHFEPNPRAVESLRAMGFQQDDVFEALRVTGNNQVAACEWLCGERDSHLTDPDSSLDVDGALYKALISNPAIQLGLHNPKIMLAFLSILENPSSANLWLNDVDTAPVLGQVFKTYHSEKHIMVVNQQVQLMRQHSS